MLSEKAKQLFAKLKLSYSAVPSNFSPSSPKILTNRTRAWPFTNMLKQGGSLGRT